MCNDISTSGDGMGMEMIFCRDGHRKETLWEWAGMKMKCLGMSEMYVPCSSIYLQQCFNTMILREPAP